MSAPEEEVPGVPEWVVTYGDMMSLLLTFFIMLVSMSELKSDGKLRAALDAISECFGPTSQDTGVLGRSLQENSALLAHNSAGDHSEGGLKSSSRKSRGPGGAHRTVSRLNHGTVVSFGGPAMFNRFDAALSDRLKKNLDRIAQVIVTKPNRLFVRGHASSEPLPADSVYQDPWDLSFARARNVAQYLIERGVDRRRVLVSAAGNAEPRLLTRVKAKQEQNRRVDVFLIDSYIRHSHPPDSLDR